MDFVDSKIIKILQTLPSEAPNLDYKERPYKKNKDIDFIKDIIAMLNAEAAMYDDKFIICGVDNSCNLVGIEEECWRDDNEWQNLIKKIVPRPIDIRTGKVQYEGKIFGYIYISKINDEWIYESGESRFPDNEQVKEKNSLFKGQALTRRGGSNEILFSKDRQRILDKKKQSVGIAYPIVTNSSMDNELARLFGLYGAWNENYKGDVEVLQILTGIKKETLIKKVRKYNTKEQDIISYSSGVWRTRKHCDILLQEADKIYDNHIDIFFEILKQCFKEIDPKCNLSAKQRYMSALITREDSRKYSKLLTNGMAETVAIMGNNEEAFINCSKHKILFKLCDFEREFFKSSDWRVFASNADYLEFLGEACPSIFLDEIIKLTSRNDNAFVEFLKESEMHLTTVYYGYQLSWIISNIAKIDSYFSKAMLALFQLAKIRIEFLNDMVGIVLPWYPQTNASIAKRVGVFKGLVEEDEALVWDALMRLMPGVTTTGNPIQPPKFLKVDDVSKTVTQKEYIEATIGYINMAIELIGTNVNRMCEMISVIDDVGEDIQQQILESIKEKCVELNVVDKEILWNRMQDFLHKHRRFPESNWALPEERLYSIEEVARWVLPDSNHANAVRLFREDQYSLYEEKEDFASEETKLRKRQVKVLKEIYDKKKIEGLLEFIDEVSNKEVVGICATAFLTDDDIRDIIRRSECIEKDALLKGIIINLKFERIATVIENMSDDIKARVLSYMALTEQTMTYVSSLDEQAKKTFWSLNLVWGFETNNPSICETAVLNLNGVNRNDKSIFILYNFLRENETSLKTQLVVDTLNINVEKTQVNSLEEYYIQHLIKWLQKKVTDTETMVLLEWRYLAFLQESEGCPPIFIWNELSTNPEFFIEILKILCGKEGVFNGTAEEKTNVVNNCRRLLLGWKKVPGICMDGTFKKDIFDKWLDYVTAKSKELAIDGMALKYFGKTAFHAPFDEDGFFIEMVVAKYLQNDKDGHALSGYYAEAINSRGAHSVDPTGEAEFAIEADYQKKAAAADERGLFRLSETLRRIANSYHEEGMQNIEYGRNDEDY